VTIELVVTDLDGTLWELETAVHDRTRAAILHLLDQSTPLLVATGRRVGSTREPLAAIGLAPPAVVLNGALGLDLASGDRFHRGGFGPDEAAAVLEAHLAHGIEPCIYVDHDDHPVWVSPNPSTHPDHIAGFGDDVSSGELRAIVETEDVLAFSVLGIDERSANLLGRDLAAIATPHVDRDRQYGGHSVTVAPLAQSKWDGVAAFCALHDLDPNAVMAIGDGPNDAELLENAAVAVVPDDAHPDARRHADHVVGSARDGGWADILHLLDIALPG
jgi:hydroxymethylpyrimidine pyrophosphatase-like HAD family hydrolase